MALRDQVSKYYEGTLPDHIQIPVQHRLRQGYMIEDFLQHSVHYSLLTAKEARRIAYCVRNLIKDGSATSLNVQFSDTVSCADENERELIATVAAMPSNDCSYWITHLFDKNWERRIKDPREWCVRYQPEYANEQTFSSEPYEVEEFLDNNCDLTPLFANAAGKVMEWHRQRNTLASAAQYRPHYQPVQPDIAAAQQPLDDAHASSPPADPFSAASRTNSANDPFTTTATHPTSNTRCVTSCPVSVPPETDNEGPSHEHSHSTAPPATLQQHPSDAINMSHPPAADTSQAAQRTNSAEDTLARTFPTTRDTNIAKSFAPSNGSNHCLSQAPAYTPVSPEASNEGISQLHAQSTARSSPKHRPTPLPRSQFTTPLPTHAADTRVCTPPLTASDHRDPASTTLDFISSITALPLTAEAKLRMTLILIQDRHPELYASLNPESSMDKRRKQSREAPQKQPNGRGRGGTHHA